MISKRRNCLNRFKRQTNYLAKVDQYFLKCIHVFNRALVKGPQEATLDSHLLLMATNVGAQKARAMKSGSGSFDIDDFVSKLLKFLKDDHLPEDVFSEDSDAEESNDPITPLDWDRIGRKAMAKSRRIPVMGFMYSFLLVWFLRLTRC